MMRLTADQLVALIPNENLAALDRIASLDNGARATFCRLLERDDNLGPVHAAPSSRLAKWARRASSITPKISLGAELVPGGIAALIVSMICFIKCQSSGSRFPGKVRCSTAIRTSRGRME